LFPSPLLGRRTQAARDGRVGVPGTQGERVAARTARPHLAIALGTEAIVAGSSGYFVTIQDLVSQFQRAHDENKLKERMSLLVKPKLLILDEMSYLTLDSFAATCLFQLVSERYEKGYIILTANKSYGNWRAIFADNVIASAILDRLLHHCTTINIKGSYRLEDKKAGVAAAKTTRKWSIAPDPPTGAFGFGLRPPPYPPASPQSAPAAEITQQSNDSRQLLPILDGIVN
jgi:hypothetical protein